MKIPSSTSRIPTRFLGLALSSAVLSLVANSAMAQSGTWNVNASGTWSGTGNWAAGVVADGSGNTADFGQVDLTTADRTVTLDSARTIGNLIFGDTGTTTALNWILSNGGNTANILTLAGGTPTITVNSMGTGKTATVGLELSGTQGLIKAGTGTLVLTGSNSYSGGTTINAGLLQVGNGGTTGVLGSGTINLNVANNLVGLQISRSDAFTLTNVIIGTGRLGIAGTGTTILTGSNSYSSFTVVNSGATVQGSVSTKYSGNQTVTSVFGTQAIATSGVAGVQFRANGLDNATVQTLTFNNAIQAASGGTVNIDVNREASSTGSNKIIALATTNSLNMGINGTGTTAINLTGGNGYSLAVPNVSMGGGATTGSFLLNPTTANFLVSNASATGTGIKTLILGGTSTGNVVSGTIFSGSGTVLVTKADVGTWTLSGTSTYTGATTINAGTLVVGVSGSGAITASAVTVNAGTLAGTGRITNAVTVGDGTGSADAMIAAGNSGIGTISTGALSLLSDAQFKFELNSSTSLADQLNVTGAVAINSSAVFSFTDLGAGTIAQNTVFTIIANDGSDAITGAFSNLAQGSTFTSGANTYQVDYLGGTGNDLTLTVVPEPATWALLAGGLTVAAVFRRRHS